MSQIVIAADLNACLNLTRITAVASQIFSLLEIFLKIEIFLSSWSDADHGHCGDNFHCSLVSTVIHC